VCFSPDGQRLATASYDHTVRVWDAEKGLEMLVLRGHTFWVNSVCFKPRRPAPGHRLMGPDGAGVGGGRQMAQAGANSLWGGRHPAFADVWLTCRVEVVEQVALHPFQFRAIARCDQREFVSPGSDAQLRQQSHEVADCAPASQPIRRRYGSSAYRAGVV